MRNLELQAPEILKHVCIFFDYAILEETPNIVKQSFSGERLDVLEYVKRIGLPFIDPGRQLFLENLISLASYMFPTKYLVFMDDDFFINNAESVDKLLDPLKRGYLLSGRYVKVMDRIHTCFFALKPECLRDELLLFDDGENLYGDTSIDTGTITYRALSSRDKGVFILSDHWDADVTLGRHLCHCASELWNDFPPILMAHFQREKLDEEEVGNIKMNIPILLEALALLLKVHCYSDSYDPVDNELRRKAINDFIPYFSKVYNNYRWLVREANSR